ncbi:ankyrin-3-like isoform X2 [Octopus sinensis]|uniref:Ankyrin-3-like isoform X2 n=1 Tax=Octopus sinensis TaxID=2607531 RepID=A0A7E6FGS0_9MOLL|nr:ankyrin-3-like isoform X2 [Octopus sinensis]
MNYGFGTGSGVSTFKIDGRTYTEKDILCKLIQGDSGWIKQCFTQNPRLIPQNSVCGLSFLSIACRLGDIATVKLLIENNAQCNVNAFDKNGFTPLHYAVLGNHLEVMSLMLNYGAKVNIQNDEGHSPLHLAIIKNYINLVKPLLEAAGDSVKVCIRNTDDTQARIFQVCMRKTRCRESMPYMSHTAARQTRKKVGNNTNLLDLACDSNNVDMVKLLLKFCVVKMGYDTALHLACCVGHIKSVKLILQSEQDSNVVRNNGFTALHIACDKGFTDIADLLIRFKSDINMVSTTGDTALHIACSKKFVDVVKLLVKFDADVNIVNSHGHTALHIACDEECTDIANFLIQSKSDINMISTSGDTALHIACSKKFVDVVKLLVKFDADVNIVNSHGYTALHIACDKECTDIANFLIQSKSDINMVSASGYTALHIACNKGFTDIVDLLIQSGADINKKDKYNETSLQCAVLRQHQDIVKLILSQAEVEFDIRNTHDQTPFLQAVSKGNLEIMQMLVLKGADLDAINKDGDNCLHIALREKMFHSKSKHLEILDEISCQLKEDRLSSIVVAGYLATQGANFYHKNKNNTTPLDIIKNSDLKSRLELYLVKVYECYVCGDNRVSIKFHPCRHRIICEECCSKIKIKKCNRCKQTVIHKTRFDGSEFKTVNPPQVFKNKQLSDEMICTICMEHRWDMVFDCGHTTCKKCGEVLDKCHMCRKHIKKKIMIH